jgi:tRNA (guanine-N7-)-methyltransferase
MPDTADSDRARDLRSFGRRHGRKLSARQARLIETVLPQVAVDLAGEGVIDPEELFVPAKRETWLEIGFGGGEHLLWHGARNGDVGLIGCEPFEDGVVKVLAAIEEQGLRNIRLLADDARPLLRRLAPASIARAFVLFPDPWPKRKHQKRRLVNAELLELLARVLRPGGELRIGTDIADYARTMLMAFQREPRFTWTAAGPQDWRVRPDDWPQTRYEAKAEREGRRSVYLRFVRAAGEVAGTRASRHHAGPRPAGSGP